MFKVIQVSGIAKNAKSGAVLVTSDDAIYIKDKLDWDDLLDKKVTVSGVLKQENLIPVAQISKSGLVSQGKEGEGKESVLHNVKILKVE